MIRHIWSVLCSKSSIDKDTNNVSLFEVLEQVSFNVKGPYAEKAKKIARNEHIVAPFNFEVVTLLDRESPRGEPEVALKAGIVDPAGKTLGNFDHLVRFVEGKRRMRVVMKIIGMPVNKSGVYRVMIMLKEQGGGDYKIVAEIPLEVTIGFN